MAERKRFRRPLLYHGEPCDLHEFLLVSINLKRKMPMELSGFSVFFRIMQIFVSCAFNCVVKVWFFKAKQQILSVAHARAAERMRSLPPALRKTMVFHLETVEIKSEFQIKLLLPATTIRPSFLYRIRFS